MSSLFRQHPICWLSTRVLSLHSKSVQSSYQEQQPTIGSYVVAGETRSGGWFPSFPSPILLLLPRLQVSHIMNHESLVNESDELNIIRAMKETCRHESRLVYNHQLARLTRHQSGLVRASRKPQLSIHHPSPLLSLLHPRLTAK